MPECDSGVHVDSVSVDWGIEEPLPSERDRTFPALSAFESPFWDGVMIARTGGTGFIGSRAVMALRATGSEVMIVGRAGLTVIRGGREVR